MTDSGPDGGAGGDVERWHVIIEETVGFGRENQRWEITSVRPCEGRAEAVRIAVESAKGHRPEHPLSPRGRTVYQVGSDTWLVRITGMTRDYHYRVCVARLVDGPG